MEDQPDPIDRAIRYLWQRRLFRHGDQDIVVACLIREEDWGPDRVDVTSDCEMTGTVVYFDVDDALVRTFGTKRMPILAAVNQERSLHAHGVILYLWSTGGAQYSQATAAELGISVASLVFLQSRHT
jgi:hypothetical protein